MSKTTHKNTAESLWRQVIDAPWMSPAGLLRAVILWPLSVVYRVAVALSKLFAPKPLETQAPVIVVGGLTVGGAGKTPFVAFLMRELQAARKSVGVALSGYGREENSALVCSGAELLSLPVAVTGDEPRELAAQFPQAHFAVNKSKREAVRALDSSDDDVDVIIVDDGFQTRGLKPEIRIALVSAQSGPGDLRVLPAGRLRESLAGLRGADVVVISKLETVDSEPPACVFENIKSVYHGPFGYAAYGFELKCVTETGGGSVGFPQSVCLVSGLADNDEFKRSASRVREEVGAKGLKIAGALGFGDHFRYDSDSVDEIVRYAKETGADALLTTAKDWSKLSAFDWETPVWTLPVRVELRDKSQFMTSLAEMLDSHRLSERRKRNHH